MDRVRTILTVVAISTLTTCGALLIVGTNPVDVFSAFFKGTFSSWRHFAHVINVWIPLVICSCGLLFTFSLGLWNIGVEGQIMLGAVGTAWVMRHLADMTNPTVTLGIAFLMACLLGAIWATLSGILKIKSNVHEIFSGLGLNFVAQALVLWLIFGPWKRPGVASMSGTRPFPAAVWFPVPEGWRFSPIALVAALLVMGITAWIFISTRWGLLIRAVGNNSRAAEVHGISINGNFLLAMAVAGFLAGMTGYYQAVFVYHRLIPAISSNYGYLSLLVVMLAQYRWTPVPFIALLFAMLHVGSIQLPLTLNLDSSLGGVIQGILVLTTLGVVHFRRNS
ncbi:MAG: ABC transporter permease [Deltaproteobacteria bacterium]|nr:ABC transporter permease [Deltaproteobacteria bacterium]MBW2067936.1 ABC transporter permease [Deltaproteobacteria bacterium]